MTVTLAPVATVSVTPSESECKRGADSAADGDAQGCGGEYPDGPRRDMEHERWGHRDGERERPGDGQGVGAATITATSEGQSGTATVTVSLGAGGDGDGGAGKPESHGGADGAVDGDVAGCGGERVDGPDGDVELEPAVAGDGEWEWAW